jgi:hypothetical protein
MPAFARSDAEKSQLFSKMVRFQIGNENGLTFTFVSLDGLRLD